MIKEIALADLDTMRAAIAAGVNRVELNSRLDLGGLHQMMRRLPLLLSSPRMLMLT